MRELEILENDFAPLRDAATAPLRLALEDCDLVAHPPPRDLAGLTTLELCDCELTADALAAWLAACPDLATLEIERAELDELHYAILPPRLQRLTICGGRLTRLLDPPTTNGLQAIELSACQLEEVQLPTSLGSLRTLSLCFNANLRALPALPWAAAPFDVDLRGCGLTAWPDIEGVDKVRRIDLSGNALGEVPAAIDACTSLERLRLQDCALTRIDPAIADLRHLRELWLQDNPLGEWPTGVERLRELRVLDLRRCGLRAWPSALHLATKLEVLQLSENEIECVPDDACQLRHLRTLHLWKTGLRQLPESLQGLTALAQLELSYNPLPVLPDLSGLQALGYLGLCGLRDLDWQQGFDRLAELPSIGQISVTNCEFEQFDPRVMRIPGLHRIDANKTKVPAMAWRQLREQFPDVTIWGA